MKLNEIIETGFFVGELDNKREIIYEVINNTDEEWLKETPEQTLLIDEWTYEYTDEENRKHYEVYGGNLVSVVNAEPIDVIKITDTKYTMDVSDATIASKCNGTAMMEDKPTRLEITQQQLDQLKVQLLDQEAETLKAGGIIETLTKENEELKEEVQQALKKNAENYSNSCLLQKEVNKLKEQVRNKGQECEELKEQLTILDDEDVIVEITVKQFEEYKKLKAENKKLEEGLDTLYKFNRKIIDEKLKVDCQNTKLKQTLGEIKEVVGIGLVDGLQPEEYSGFLKILQAQILQKISECEVEDV